MMTRKTDTKTDPDNDPGNAPDTDSTATCTVVWAAGVQGDPAVGAWGLPVGPAGRVPVKSTLRVPGHPEVFAAADLACVEADGQPLPQVAQVALQQGSMTADNVLRMIKGETPGDFAYRDLSMLTVIGRNAAVAHLGGGGAVIHRLRGVDPVARRSRRQANRLSQPGDRACELGLELCFLSAGSALDSARCKRCKRCRHAPRWPRSHQWRRSQGVLRS